MHLLAPDHSPMSASAFDPGRARAANDGRYEREPQRRVSATMIPSFIVTAQNPLDDEYPLGGYYNDAGATLKLQFDAHWSANVGATHASNHAFYANTASFTHAAQTRDVGGTRDYLVLQGTF
ncbi:MAG: hypothetical protein ABI846_04095 [Rudaea sp.]